MLKALGSSSQCVLPADTCENQQVPMSRCAPWAPEMPLGAGSSHPRTPPPQKGLSTMLLRPVWGNYMARWEERGQAGLAAWRKGPIRGQKVAQGRTHFNCASCPAPLLASHGSEAVCSSPASASRLAPNATHQGPGSWEGDS